MSMGRTGALRLLAFAALATFVAVLWASMLVDPPLLAALGVTAAISLAGAVLIALERTAVGRPRRDVLAGVVLVLGLIVALPIAGLPVRLLAPAGWSELGTGIDVGLAEIGQGVEYPYAGANEWSRLAIMLALPGILALAAGLALWPLRRPAGRPRLAGLAVLLGGYLTATTANDDGATLAGGLLLAALVGAWIWLPRLNVRAGRAAADGRGRSGALLVAVALAAAIALTLRFDDHGSIVDYKSWGWSGSGDGYAWDHTYGPIDWPRDGRTVFTVEADRPAYWKASVLDRFDGRSWRRSAEQRAPLELPAQAEPDAEPRLDDPRLDPGWTSRYRVTIDELRSELVIGPGTGRFVLTGADAELSGDRAELIADPELRQGDAYIVRAYAPDPTVAQMRAASGAVSPRLARYLVVELPRTSPATEPVALNTRGIGEGRAEGAAAALAGSAYGRMFELARRLTSDRGTTYDAVKAVETHLLAGYAYDERPPARRLPLDSFLFEDGIGYCQQFSGAMALLLRMAGIPARVVGGFAPGVRDGSSGTYRVRDLDAHSWVEVYFNGIGWVPFDPTPGRSPAEGQAGGELVASAAASGISEGVDLGALLSGVRLGARQAEAAGGGRAPGAAGDATTSHSGGGSPLLPWAPLATLLALAAAAAMQTLRRLRSWRALPAVAARRARVEELGRALEAFGWSSERDRPTLLALERRLRRRRCEERGRAYVSGLRESCYAPAGARGRQPAAAQRRALRRHLAQGGGWRGRLRALRLMPPLVPRVRPPTTRPRRGPLRALRAARARSGSSRARARPRS